AVRIERLVLAFVPLVARPVALLVIRPAIVRPALALLQMTGLGEVLHLAFGTTRALALARPVVAATLLPLGITLPPLATAVIVVVVTAATGEPDFVKFRLGLSCIGSGGLGRRCIGHDAFRTIGHCRLNHGLGRPGLID